MAEVSKPKLTKRIILFIAIGLATLFLYLYYYVGTTNVIDVIRQTNIPLFTSAFFAFIISIFFTSLAWRSLLKSINVKISVKRALAFTWVGLFIDSVVPDPGWSGDLSKAYMLSKDLAEDGGKIGASVVGQKIIVMGVTVLDLFLGIVILAFNYTLPGSTILFIALVLVIAVSALAVLWYLSSSSKATKTLLDWFVRFLSFFLRKRWNSQDFRARAENVLDTFHEGMRSLKAKPRALIQPVALSLAAWIFDISVVFLVFASLKFPVSVDKVLIVYALTGSLQAWGVSLLGFTEIIMSSAYYYLGIPLTISLAATLLVRVVTLWFKLILSYFAFQWAGVHLILGQHPERSKIKSSEIQADTRSLQNGESTDVSHTTTPAKGPDLEATPTIHKNQTMTIKKQHENETRSIDTNYSSSRQHNCLLPHFASRRGNMGRRTLNFQHNMDLQRHIPSHRRHIR